jgi:hypothetical protein
MDCDSWLMISQVRKVGLPPLVVLMKRGGKPPFLTAIIWLDVRLRLNV